MSTDTGSGNERHRDVSPASQSNVRSQGWGTKCLHLFSSAKDGGWIDIFGIYFMTSLNSDFVEIPLTRLIENAVCQDFHKLHTPIFKSLIDRTDEMLCKATPIQSEVALLLGGRESFNAIPGILCAFYSGYLSDRYGRRLMLSVCCTGEVLALLWIVVVCYLHQFFPIKAIWIASLFLFTGGGQRISKSILYTMLTETSPESKRTRLLYLLHTAGHLSGMFASPLASLFMTRSLWLPFVISFIAFALQYIMIFAAPETNATTLTGNELAQNIAVQPGEVRPLLWPNLGLSEPESTTSVDGTSPSDSRAEDGTLEKYLDLIRTPKISICILLFLLKRVAFQSEKLFYQYASERFAITLDQTPWFSFGLSFGALIVTGLILPLATLHFRSKGVRYQRIDLFVIRASLLLMVFTFGAIPKFTQPIIFGALLLACGFGEGLEPALQGLATTLLDRSRNTQFFMSVAVMDTLAKISSGPMMAKLYKTGRDQNGQPDGLYFFVSSCIFLLSFLLSLLLSVHR